MASFKKIEQQARALAAEDCAKLAEALLEPQQTPLAAGSAPPCRPC